MLPRPVAVGLSVLVGFMWAVNLTVGYVYPGRSEPYVNAIFGTIIGAVFVIGRKNNPPPLDRRKPKDEPPSEEGESR